jgi:RNA polymerase sigma-70 factor, ECF subfamily
MNLSLANPRAVARAAKAGGERRSATMPPPDAHPAPPPAAALTAGVARGDPDAFEALYRAWAGRVCALARSASGRDEAFALDATQEVMLRVASSMKPLRGETELAAWMTRTTLSVVIDAIRRESRRARRERAAAMGQAADPDPRADADWLAARVASLPLTDYELVRSRLAHECTLRQAGLAAGVTEGSAHGRIRRAIESLRDAARRLAP